jgi:hypothetical protein
VATTTPLWQWSSAGRKRSSQQQYVPAPRPIQNRLLLVCQSSQRRRKEGGIGTAMRSARGPAHVHAGGQGRLHIGRTQSTQPSCWLPWHGRRRHLAGLRTWPIGYTYRLACLGAWLVPTLLQPCGLAQRTGPYGAATLAKPCARRANTSGAW